MSAAEVLDVRQGSDDDLSDALLDRVVALLLRTESDLAATDRDMPVRAAP